MPKPLPNPAQKYREWLTELKAALKIMRQENPPADADKRTKAKAIRNKIWAEIWATFYPDIKSIVDFKMNNVAEMDREDVAISVITALFDTIEEKESDITPEKLPGFIFAITKNKISDYFKRRMRQGKRFADINILKIQKEVSEKDRFEAQEEIKRLEKGYKKLGRKHQMVLLLKYHQKLTTREIMDVMGLSKEHDVHNLLDYAKRKLKSLFGDSFFFFLKCCLQIALAKPARYHFAYFSEF